jgi:hypothetical protein
MGFEVGGLLGLLVLIADVYAILQIASSDRQPATRAIWIIIVLLLPVIGFVAWLIAGPSGRDRLGGASR